MLRTARWRKTLRKRATWALGVAAVGFREDLSACPSTGGSGAFGGTQLGTMERRPWRGMGGFINAPAQNECSGGLGWIEASAGQYSVIPSSILTHFSKWPSCLAAGLSPRFFFEATFWKMTKVPLPYVLVRACPCLSTTYASPNFRAFLTCSAPENWKSRPEAATSTPTNPRSRCTTKSTTIQALSNLLVGNTTRLFACRVGAHDEIPRVCQLHGECNLPQLADCAVSDMISITHAGF